MGNKAFQKMADGLSDVLSGRVTVVVPRDPLIDKIVQLAGGDVDRAKDAINASAAANGGAATVHDVIGRLSASGKRISYVRTELIKAALAIDEADPKSVRRGINAIRFYADECEENLKRGWTV